MIVLTKKQLESKKAGPLLDVVLGSELLFDGEVFYVLPLPGMRMPMLMFWKTQPEI